MTIDPADETTRGSVAWLPEAGIFSRALVALGLVLVFAAVILASYPLAPAGIAGATGIVGLGALTAALLILGFMPPATPQHRSV